MFVVYVMLIVGIKKNRGIGLVFLNLIDFFILNKYYKVL